MSTIDASRFVDLLRSGLVPVAGPQEGVCRKCRSGANAGFSDCYQCSRGGVVEVLPISMSVHGGPFHHRLRNYKDDTRYERRREYTLQLAALLSEFAVIWIVLAANPKQLRQCGLRIGTPRAGSSVESGLSVTSTCRWTGSRMTSTCALWHQPN